MLPGTLLTPTSCLLHHSSACCIFHLLTNQLAKRSTCNPGNVVFKLHCAKSYRPSTVAMSICNLRPRARSPRTAAAASSVRRVLTLCTTKGWNLSSSDVVSQDDCKGVSVVYHLLFNRCTRMVRLWTVTLSPHMRSSDGHVRRSMALVTNLATSTYKQIKDLAGCAAWR